MAGRQCFWICRVLWNRAIFPDECHRRRTSQLHVLWWTKSFPERPGRKAVEESTDRRSCHHKSPIYLLDNLRRICKKEMDRVENLRLCILDASMHKRRRICNFEHLPLTDVVLRYQLEGCTQSHVNRHRSHTNQSILLETRNEKSNPVSRCTDNKYKNRKCWMWSFYVNWFLENAFKIWVLSTWVLLSVYHSEDRILP